MWLIFWYHEIEHHAHEESCHRDDRCEHQADLIGQRPPKDVLYDCQTEPKGTLALAQQSLSFRVAVHRVEGSNVGVGGWTRHSFVRLTIIGVGQGPHSGPIVVVEAPIIFLAFESLDKSVA